MPRKRAKLEHQLVEMLPFDDKMRHYADMRVSIDLNDGVKIKHGKIGNLLDEAKAVASADKEKMVGTEVDIPIRKNIKRWKILQRFKRHP